MQDHNVNGKRILAAILKSIKKKKKKTKPNQTLTKFACSEDGFVKF